MDWLVGDLVDRYVVLVDTCVVLVSIAGEGEVANVGRGLPETHKTMIRCLV